MWVFGLLAVVWIAALAPSVLRKLHEREVVSSVTTFNRQLLKLSGVPNGFGHAGLITSPQRTSHALDRSGAVDRLATRTALRSAAPSPVVSRTTRIRRRRVVAILVSGTLLSLLCGLAVPAALYLALFGFFFLLVYLALLGYFHRLEVEQAQKVVALETRRDVALALDQARHAGELAQGEGSPGAETPARAVAGASCWSLLPGPVEPQLASAGS